MVLIGSAFAEFLGFLGGVLGAASIPLRLAGKPACGALCVMSGSAHFEVLIGPDAWARSMGFTCQRSGCLVEHHARICLSDDWVIEIQDVGRCRFPVRGTDSSAVTHLEETAASSKDGNLSDCRARRFDCVHEVASVKRRVTVNAGSCCRIQMTHRGRACVHFELAIDEVVARRSSLEFERVIRNTARYRVEAKYAVAEGILAAWTNDSDSASGGIASGPGTSEAEDFAVVEAVAFASDRQAHGRCQSVGREAVI